MEKILDKFFESKNDKKKRAAVTRKPRPRRSTTLDEIELFGPEEDAIEEIEKKTEYGLCDKSPEEIGDNCKTCMMSGKCKGPLKDWLTEPPQNHKVAVVDSLGDVVAFELRTFGEARIELYDEEGALVNTYKLPPKKQR